MKQLYFHRACVVVLGAFFEVLDITEFLQAIEKCWNTKTQQHTATVCQSYESPFES